MVPALRRTILILIMVAAYSVGVITWLCKRHPSEFQGFNNGILDTQEPLLAIVLPIHDGDAALAMTAMSKWPTTCYSNTLTNMDLIIYKAEAVESTTDLLSQVPREASGCFRSTKVITGNLTPEVCTIQTLR
ncbi:unnamed protein product [Ectocarpus sp. CCAP 1310/34]|nr:unnamed protein product [Ectocarpus sp. CCAP 1310/34]